MDAGLPLLDARRQQRLQDSERIQYFQGPGMHHGRPVPIQGALMRVDQQAFDVAALKFRRGKQAGRAGAHHQDGCRCHHFLAPS
ncbi:hypothetical protein D3C71_1775970 [compost metagenome]